MLHDISFTDIRDGRHAKLATGQSDLIKFEIDFLIFFLDQKLFFTFPEIRIMCYYSLIKGCAKQLISAFSVSGELFWTWNLEKLKGKSITNSFQNLKS
jgi:hypothetical protein